jgi:hypothetical protein
MRCVDFRLWHEAAVPVVGASFRSWGLSGRTTFALACALMTHCGND